MGKLFNRARMTVSGTPGTGTITLLAATTGFQSFASAGVANSDIVSYLIEDGTLWEYGQGTYTSAGTTLARTTIQGSSAGGTTAISATSNAIVSVTALAGDISSTPCFSANKNAVDQSFTTNTETKATFGTADFDIGSYYSTANSRWTPPTGKCTISARVYLTGITGGDYAVLQIYKNGSQVSAFDKLSSSSAEAIFLNVNGVFNCNGTDYFEIFVDSTSATGSPILHGDTAYTMFCGFTLR